METSGLYIYIYILFFKGSDYSLMHMVLKLIKLSQKFTMLGCRIMKSNGLQMLVASLLACYLLDIGCHHLYTQAEE